MKLRCFPVAFILFFFSLGLHAQQSVDETSLRFSVTELQQDFNTIRHHWETSLTNLYLYTPETQLQASFDSLYQNLYPMNAREFYNYITPLLSEIKDGHSYMYPKSATDQLHNDTAKFFPFQILFTENKMFVTMNLSANESIREGTEILSINGIKAMDLFSFLKTRQVRDGLNENYPNWILNTYFKEYYSFSFGHPENYTLILKKQYDTPEVLIISALKRDSIKEYKMLRYPQKYAKTLETKGIELQIDDSIKTAVLRIRSWDDQMLKSMYAQKFKSEIAQKFEEINSKEIKHLIIDLRDNQGGEANNGILLMSYLMDTPFVYLNELQKVKLKGNGERKIQNKKANFLKVQNPVENNFRGNVYILINGGSFSNSAIFSSRMQYYKRAVIIGEESGGNKTVLTGTFGWKKDLTLQNTGIICANANYRLLISDMSENNGRGVIPDHQIIPGLYDVIRDRDPAMIYTLDLINK